MQATGVFPGNSQRHTSLDPYSTQARRGIQNLQEKGWQTQNPEHRHQALVKFMAKLLQKYPTPYFEKLLIRRKQDNKIFSKIWGKLTRQEGHVHVSHFGRMQKPKLLVILCTGKIFGCTICSQCMHSDCTGYGLHLEAWCSRHSYARSSRKQLQYV